jgi:hypothetical protein
VLDHRIVVYPSNSVYDIVSTSSVALNSTESRESAWICGNLDYVADTTYLFVFCRGKGLVTQLSRSNNEINQLYQSSVEIAETRDFIVEQVHLEMGDGFIRYYTNSAIAHTQIIMGIQSAVLTPHSSTTVWFATYHRIGFTDSLSVTYGSGSPF